MPQKKPNVLFFFTDQQRWDTVGCYGQKLDVTPNVDRMASQGVRFENAFTCQPVCGPARSCLQTGKYATETGCFRNGIALQLDARTIAHWFSEAGYEAGYVGKWHLASNHLMGAESISFHESPVPPERRGGYMDYWVASDVLEFTSHSYDGHMFDAAMNKVEFPKDRYRVDCVTDFAVDYLRNRGSEKPFFLFISYIEPHHQNDHDRYEGPRGSKEKFSDYEVPGDLAGTEGDWRENYPDYLGCINALDAALGRLQDELTDLGMAENTVILYSSDHGSHFKTRNDEYKRSCHDGCVRIPLVVHGPGFTGGRVVRELVGLIDLPPTLLRIAGIDTPETMQGRPLQLLVDGSTDSWVEEVFIQISESQIGRALRTPKWKYSVRAPGEVVWEHTHRSDVYVEDFLYDLQVDPHERNNLVADPAYLKVRAELAETLKRHMARAGESVPLIKPSSV
jgi:uncharacterized sulfatase